VSEETTKTPPSLKTQSAWLLFAKVIGFGFTFLLPLIIVRFLSKEEVGIYRQVFQIVINAVTILPLGISMSAYYFLSRETAERRLSVVFNILIFNFFVGGIACLTLYFYPSLIGDIFQSAEITHLAPKIGVVIWLWIFSAFLETIAIANQEPRIGALFIILAQFTKTVLMILAVVIFATVESFVYAAMLQAFIQTIVLFVYLTSRFPKFWKSFDARFFREQIFYALPFGLVGLLWILQTDIHNYFVGYRFSPAEYAVYAYGCFQLPLIGILSDSVTSVLIPRMSELQAKNDKREMIRLTIRAIEKLAFFFFPMYVFLIITAQTFITTLFTRNYLASVPIFLINLTLLPFYIWITDPIVRAYQELGKILLTMRVLILVAMVAALYYGIQNFDLRGMIAIVVVTALVEKFVFSFLVFKKLEMKRQDLFLLKNVGKTAVASLAAGFFTALFYWQFSETLFVWGTGLASVFFAEPKAGITDFTSGTIVLGFSALVFAPIYFLIANYFDLIEDAEKQKAKSIFAKLTKSRNQSKPEDLIEIVNRKSQTEN
jgi:O-antigen/teichoic acid export membrane protein